MIAHVLRVAGCALLILVVACVVIELVLRWRSMEPQDLYRAGFTATVIDRWTEWGMRPNVRLNEYAVTNNYGLHEDREVNLEKPSGMRRVAMVGSSVTWALGEPLENTIPRSAERQIRESGCTAEVLNFAGQGYNILNASAFVQTKVHQFHPDAIVVIMDLQMAFPQFPRPNPITDERAAIRQLGFFEGLFKRATEYSVLLTMLDNTAVGRDFLAKRLPFPVEVPAPRATAKTAQQQDPGEKYLSRFLDAIKRGAPSVFDRLKARDPGGGVTVKPAPRVPPREAEKPSAPQYEARRERELGGVVAALAAFAREMGIALYFVTPYGPYFHADAEDYRKFSLGMLRDTIPIYGGLEDATRHEVELASAIIERHAKREGAQVIDMLPLTRAATMASGDFSSDGIHFSAKGYRHVGAIVGDRLLKDGLCGGK